MSFFFLDSEATFMLVSCDSQSSSALRNKGEDASPRSCEQKHMTEAFQSVRNPTKNCRYFAAAGRKFVLQHGWSLMTKC